MGVHPSAPASSHRYVRLLCFTFSAAAAVYFGAKWLLGVPAALLAAFLLGHGHYLMAYFWSVPGYGRMAAGWRWGSLWSFGALISLFWYLVFVAGTIPFPGAIFAVIMIGVVHNFRDYEFFYRQMASDFREGKRTLAVTALASSVYLAVLFASLLAAPGRSAEVFGMDFPPLLFQAGFAAALITAAIALMTLAPALARPGRLAALALPLPFAAGFLGRISPLDLVYLFTVWHFMLWLGFTAAKIAGRPQMRPALTAGAASLLLQRWNGGLASFWLMTALLYAAVVAPLAVLAASGLFPSVEAVAYGGSPWGIRAFILASFAHIVFTALPRGRRA